MTQFRTESNWTETETKIVLPRKRGFSLQKPSEKWKPNVNRNQTEIKPKKQKTKKNKKQKTQKKLKNGTKIDFIIGQTPINQNKTESKPAKAFLVQIGQTEQVHFKKSN